MSCIVAMLIGAIDALSGGLNMYFLMSELTGGTYLLIGAKFNIKNLINVNYKDKEPPMKISGIYKINCKQCEKVYIGQTKINLETRTKEHFRNLRLNHREKSAIAFTFLKHST